MCRTQQFVYIFMCDYIRELISLSRQDYDQHLFPRIPTKLNLVWSFMSLFLLRLFRYFHFIQFNHLLFHHHRQLDLIRVFYSRITQTYSHILCALVCSKFLTWQIQASYYFLHSTDLKFISFQLLTFLRTFTLRIKRNLG